MPATRDHWASSLGFVLAAAGSAVGLANIWAFPYRTGQNGGAAFVMIYLLCIFLICLPFMFGELSLGRFRQKNVYGAIYAIKAGGPWLSLSWLCIIASIFILSFYSVVAGWGIGYIVKLFVRDATPFAQFASNTVQVLVLFFLFLLLTLLVVHKGVQKGIERSAKILMPTLIVLMLILIIYGLSLPGATKGLTFFLNPDFGKVTGNTIMTAMGQAFFSLSLGIGGLLTYGSYLPKSENIVRSGIYVVLLDTAIALMAGLMIFPALFSFGQQPQEGPALVFGVLPAVFQQMPAGNLLGAGFFIMLTIAALTSSVSMLEISVAYFVDEKSLPRKRVVWFVGAGVFVLGLPSALSQGAVPALSNLPFFGHKSFLELMIFLWFDIFPPLGAFLFSIFISRVWGISNAVQELRLGYSGFSNKMPWLPFTQAQVWGFFIRYICPAAILLIWVQAIFNP